MYGDKRGTGQPKIIKKKSGGPHAGEAKRALIFRATKWVKTFAHGFALDGTPAPNQSPHSRMTGEGQSGEEAKRLNYRGLQLIPSEKFMKMKY